VVRKEFAPLPSFPAVLRDLSIVVPQSVPYAEVAPHVRGAGDINVMAELVDVYEGKPLPAGTKSFTFHLEYLADNRTLTSEEVDALHARIVAELGQAVGATLRT
jgi:phenylalanyl-tRNA synthetase beta chain